MEEDAGKTEQGLSKKGGARTELMVEGSMAETKAGVTRAEMKAAGPRE